MNNFKKRGLRLFLLVYKLIHVFLCERKSQCTKLKQIAPETDMRKIKMPVNI